MWKAVEALPVLLTLVIVMIETVLMVGPLFLHQNFRHQLLTANLPWTSCRGLGTTCWTRTWPTMNLHSPY